MGPLGLNASTGPLSTPVKEMAFLVVPDKLSPLLLPVPPPHVHQITICGHRTIVHPYWVSFQCTHRVFKGTGCHRRDYGKKIVPNRDPLVAINSNACALSKCDGSGPETNEIYILGAQWNERAVGINFCPLSEA